MLHNIRRYQHGLQKVRWWLPLALLPLLIYLLIAAAIPDRFSVNQILAVQRAAPIALSRSPVDILTVKTMEEVASNPSGLFLDEITLMNLIKYFEQWVQGSKGEQKSRNLRVLIENSMSMKTIDNAHVLLSYYGHDLEMGKMLVNYYTQQLVSRSKDGLMRSMGNINQASAPGSASPPGLQPARQGAAGAVPSQSHFQPASPKGNATIQEHRIFWRSDRLLPAVAIMAGSLVLILILVGFMKWADPSFKSERQISRYLDLRVIGVMPDIEPLVRRMQPKNPSH